MRVLAVLVAVLSVLAIAQAGSSSTPPGFACVGSTYTIGHWPAGPYQADATVHTWVSRPSFPSYPSAHSCLSSAAGEILSSYFPSATSEMHALVAEAGVSRIYGGLHFRFDVTAGQTLGSAVARRALRDAPKGHRAIPLE